LARLSSRTGPPILTPLIKAAEASVTADEALHPSISRIMPPAPSAVVGLTREGLSRFAVGDYRTAEQAFRTVVEVAPHQAMAWSNLALVLVALGELEQAVPALSRSLGLDATQISPWVNLAGALVRLRRLDEAQAACGAALSLEPDNAEAWQILAMARAEAEDFAGAAQAFARTIDLAGETSTLRLNLAAALLKSGRFDEAAYSAARALALDLSSIAALEVSRMCDFIVAALAGDMAVAQALYPPALFDDAAETDRVFRTALLYLDWAERRDAAILVAETWGALRPGCVEAIHMRDAALSRVVARQPAELVTQAFDDIAEDFDDRLVRRLGYQGPEHLAALIAGEIAAEGVLDILDLGCGTGLCAPFLRPYARRLAGVDLSAGMLAKAAERGLYDSLEAADLLTVLSQAPAGWDLLIAGDTFPYLGDLAGVFDGAALALRPGGWFAFSTEATALDGYLLRGNGRFAHGPRYIERLAAGRFAIASQVAATLRREASSPVDGGFYLLRRLD
jgi:predicted TPR repeat methyltransferase